MTVVIFLSEQTLLALPFRAGGGSEEETHLVLP